MKRQIGLKRSFNYEDLASIVECSLDADRQIDEEKPRQKRMRTSTFPSSMIGSDDRVSANLDRIEHHSSTHLISLSSSRDRVVITPNSSPSIKSLNESRMAHTSTFSLTLDECPATAALNRSLLSQRSSLSTEWDSAVFPLEEEKKHDDCDYRWPTFNAVPSPPSLDRFPVRRVTVTSRTYALRRVQDNRRFDPDVGKLQTAFSLLSLPRPTKT